MATMMAALAMLMYMAFSQEAPDSCLDDGCSDAASVLQLSSDQSPCEWVLAVKGDTCVTACNQLLPAAKKCDPGQQRRIGGAALNTVVTALNGGVGCNNHNPPGERISTTRSDWAPYVINGGVANGDCRSSGRGSDSNCNRRGINVQRVCCCVPLGAIVGDPHIETLRGEHYTLLKGGNFVAWSFAKAPIDWQLLAAYSGVRSRFTTQSLLLVEKQSGQTLEISAEDCVWQMKTENGWHKVQPELLSQGAASLDVQEVDSITEDPLMLKSALILMANHSGTVEKVARLVTHCGAKKHLNFKVMMYQTKDLDYVGGELGGKPHPNHLSFLSAKLSLVMQSDAEFEVSESWTSLGGSRAASEYLESQLGTSLLSVPSCGQAEEQEAEKICAKHLQRDGDHPEVFADCVYDVCHGGGEADALSAAAFISA